MVLGLRSRALNRQPVQEGYRPFSNIAWRNGLQAAIEVPLLIRLLDLRPGQRILEVGCGRGVALGALAQLCKPTRLVGLDINGELLAEAAERLSRQQVSAELVCADVREIPLPDSSFDVVIDFGTCYHIAHPARALDEIARVLRIGGVFVHETPVSQLMAHPVRSLVRMVPLPAAPSLVPGRNAALWSSQIRV